MELEFDEEILQELEDAGENVELYQFVCEAENYVMSLDEFEDACPQCVDSLADWAEELCYDIHGIELSDLPDYITAHIDWEDVAINELFLSGDYSYAVDPDGGYVVWRRY